MNLRSIYPATVCGIVLLATSCDATIHEYPGKGESLVVVELNVDRTPPQYYKELVYDQDGNRSETELAPELSQTYTADERLCMRIITELYEVASTESRTNTGRLGRPGAKSRSSDSWRLRRTRCSSAYPRAATGP